MIDMRHALSGALIEARYQPIVAIADGHLCAVEALARLNHPTLGTLPPARFVPQLEQAGLAPELTAQVVACALADITAPALAAHHLRVSLNFPLDVLLRPDVLAVLGPQAARFGVDPSRIVIELTESRPVEDVAALRAAMLPLRAAGYGIAIDDVGPDVPFLAALLELPFDVLKLDRDVVDPPDPTLPETDFVARTTAAAQARGMRVVAEGVADQPTWRRMQAAGVNSVQGFLIAAAMPAADLAGWLATPLRAAAFC